MRLCLRKWNPSDANAQDTYGENLLYLNVGSGEEISIKDLAKKIAMFTNYRNGQILWDKNKPDGTYRKKASDSKKIKSIGWEPKIKLDDGFISIQIINNLKILDKNKTLKNYFGSRKSQFIC